MVEDKTRKKDAMATLEAEDQPRVTRKRRPVRVPPPAPKTAATARPKPAAAPAAVEVEAPQRKRARMQLEEVPDGWHCRTRTGC